MEPSILSHIYAVAHVESCSYVYMCSIFCCIMHTISYNYYKQHADVAKREKCVNRWETFHMSRCSIRCVLQLLWMAAHEVNWNAPCRDSCSNLVQNQMGKPEYDIRDECFPNNLAGFHNERQQSSSTWNNIRANWSLVNLKYCWNFLPSNCSSLTRLCTYQGWGQLNSGIEIDDQFKFHNWNWLFKKKRNWNW